MSHSTSNLPTVNKLTMARNHTFTLIEMLVVVVIIGILAVTLIPRLVGAKERASDSARIVKVWQISSAVELYAQEKGTTYPLAPLTTTGTSIARQDITDAISPYLTTIPTDPGKWTVAIDIPPSNIQVTGDSFAYWTNTWWTVYAITALMESKKGNTTNATQTIDSDKQWSYQKVGRWLTTNIVVAVSYPTTSWVHYVWNEIVVRNGTTIYVIADRNVGATVAGIWTTSYWRRFQWGNNYGFAGEWNVTTGSALVSYPQPPYTGSIFVLPWAAPYDWAMPQDNNLRPAKTQWPCDSWYHVPTYTERQWLYNTWLSLNPWQGSNWDLLRATLKLPKTWYRNPFSAKVQDTELFGNYWSSTPNGTDAYNVFFNCCQITIINKKYYRNAGLSVRCFKD